MIEYILFAIFAYYVSNWRSGMLMLMLLNILLFLMIVQLFALS